MSPFSKICKAFKEAYEEYKKQECNRFYKRWEDQEILYKKLQKELDDYNKRIKHYVSNN